MPTDFTDLFGATGHFGIPNESDVAYRGAEPAERRVDDGASRSYRKTLGDNQEASRTPMLPLTVWRATPIDRTTNLPASCESLIMYREGTNEGRVAPVGERI